MTLVRAVDAPSSSAGPRSWVELMGPAVELARAIAGTKFVPADMRNDPAAIAAAILYGDEVGLGPMQSLAVVKIIDGTPTLLAKAQRALVLAAGHSIWPEELGETRSSWCGRRAGEERVTRTTWTLDRARKAKLIGKTNWVNYPGPMLSARASAELVGAIFSDVVAGLVATEELDDGAETAVDAARRDRAAGDSDGPTRRRRRPGRKLAAAAADLKAAPAVLPPLPGETSAAVDDVEPGRMTDAQRRLMMKLFAERLGLRGGSNEVRAQRLAQTVEIVGRPLESSAELTVAEAGAVIEYLESLGEVENVDDAGADDAELVEPSGEADA